MFWHAILNKFLIGNAENAVKICRVCEKSVPLHTQFRNEGRYIRKYRGVEQLVARQAHNLEVACSSPASATKLQAACLFKQAVFLFLSGGDLCR